MQLNVDATVIASPGGFVAADIPVVFQFDKNGALIQPAKIWSNEELDPQNTAGLGTFYLVTFYDQNGAVLNNTPLWWIFPETIGATVDISQMVAISTVGGNVIYYPRSIGNLGTVTSVAFVGDGTVLSSTPSTPVTTSGNITATLLNQNANLVLAGPASGPSAAPTFRALVTADLPAISLAWNALQPATGQLTLANTTFDTTFNQTNSANWTWANITAATNIANQNSPILHLSTTYWNGAASAIDSWSIQNIVASGTNPVATLTFTPSGSTGGHLVSFPGSSLSAGFTITAATIDGGAAGVFNFNTGASGAVLTLTSVANAVGPLTTYTGTITSQPSLTQYVTIAGFTTGANNGRFLVQGATPTTVTVYNASGASETHAATATVDAPYVNNSGGFSTGFGNATNTYAISGSNHTPNALFETLDGAPVALTAKGNATDSEYLRIINDPVTGNHGLEVGSIIDGTGANPIIFQLGFFGGISTALFNSSITQTQTHGETCVHGTSTELITLSTGGTTTDSAANLLPAGAIIDAVVARVTTTISGGSTPTTWEIGDPTTAARFTSTGSALTAGTTVVGLNQMQGVVTTTAAGPTQAAAAKVRITLDQTPGQGAVRVTVFWRQFTAPSS